MKRTIAILVDNEDIVFLSVCMNRILESMCPFFEVDMRYYINQFHKNRLTCLRRSNA
jgi:hypothetical protein